MFTSFLFLIFFLVYFIVNSSCRPNRLSLIAGQPGLACKQSPTDSSLIQPLGNRRMIRCPDLVHARNPCPSVCPGQRQVRIMSKCLDSIFILPKFRCYSRSLGSSFFCFIAFFFLLLFRYWSSFFDSFKVLYFSANSSFFFSAKINRN